MKILLPMTFQRELLSLHLINYRHISIGHVNLNSPAPNCQPDLEYQERSLTIADLDGDKSHELISYYSTFDPPDLYTKKSNPYNHWRLLSIARNDKKAVKKTDDKENVRQKKKNKRKPGITIKAIRPTISRQDFLDAKSYIISPLALRYRKTHTKQQITKYFNVVILII
ncbi:unnamed protein product [Leptidea sinapis]|uniref:Uncharacterized protein n=1 Tax=Leptidea sinapis TaxID=189913 RepID=A0A5E4R408_9NEOP|nr:unnamed protein product [Leptidea sinapis]